MKSEKVFTSERMCAECNQPFHATRRAGKKRFCSKACCDKNSWRRRHAPKERPAWPFRLERASRPVIERQQPEPLTRQHIKLERAPRVVLERQRPDQEENAEFF